MKWLRKWWFWFILLLAVALGAWGWQSWVKKNAAPDYRTTRIEKGSITASVSSSGTLSPLVSVQVGSQVSGQLKDIFVDFNSEVKLGQLIAQIDPETFQYRVRQAQADLDAARSQVLTQQANIAAQRAQVTQVEVNLADARLDLERKQQLVDKGFISGAERDKARSVYHAMVQQLNTAKAQVQVAQANAGNADAVVRQRQAALAQAQVELGRTEIRAPVNGVVIKRSVEKGQTVAASLQAPELFIIAENLADMRVDTSIDESEIGRIREGQKATFTVDAFPGRTFEGVVKQIRKAGQNVSNVVTYMVEVSAPNPRRELLPGMTANVRIVTDSRDEVLKVANAALRFRPAGATAQQPAADPSGAGRSAGGGQSRALRERLEKDLRLSDGQKAKLETIFGGMREKMAALREAPEGERAKLAERNRADMHTRIADMLTPEQKVKYEEIAAESGNRRRANAPGRIYTLDGSGRPKELNVRLGLTDGTSTEVMSPELKEGMEIVIGNVLPQSGASQPPARSGPRMF